MSAVKLIPVSFETPCGRYQARKVKTIGRDRWVAIDTFNGRKTVRDTLIQARNDIAAAMLLNAPATVEAEEVDGAA